MKNQGTPNQKALYSTMGNALQETMTLLDMKITDAEADRKLKVIDQACRVASEMTKAKVAEIMEGKVSGNVIRCIERKDFDQVEILK